MKRFVGYLVAITMVFSLSACGESNSENTSSAVQNEEQTEQVSVESSAPVKDEPQAPERAEMTFEGLTVVDDDNIKIELTEIDEDNMWGYTFKSLLENKSSDKTYMFSVESASVNGVSTQPFFATEVAAGKKAKEEISFLDNTIEDIDIGDYTDIALTFRVYDSDDWMADPVYHDTVHVYPYGEENAKTYVRESQQNDVVLVDTGNVSATVIVYEHDSIWGYGLKVFLVNNTDSTLMYAVDNASVNGFMCDPFWATEVTPHTVAFTTINWSDSSLEDNDIESIDEIEMEFRVTDYNNLMAGALVDQIVTINPAE